MLDSKQFTYLLSFHYFAFFSFPLPNFTFILWSKTLFLVRTEELALFVQPISSNVCFFDFNYKSLDAFFAHPSFWIFSIPYILCLFIPFLILLSISVFGLPFSDYFNFTHISTVAWTIQLLILSHKNDSLKDFFFFSFHIRINY